MNFATTFPHKNLKLTSILQNPFSTICIIAGSPSNDLRAAKLMRAIKQNSKEEVHFVGIGGPHMVNEGLENQYVGVSELPDKPLFPFKNFLRFHIERIYHPVMFPLHWANKKLLEKLDKTNFFDDMKKNRPDVFLSVGNEFLMERIYKKLDDIYENNDIFKPPTMHYDSLVINQRSEFRGYLDHFLYWNPKEQINWGGFKFPQTCVGIEGVFRAYKYLYSQSAKYKGLINDKNILLNKELQNDIVEELTNQERQRFRQKFNISQDATVFYCAPGNTLEEATFAINLLGKGLDSFLNSQSIQSMGASNFHVIVSCPLENQEVVDQALSKINIPVTTTIVYSENDKFGAMAASDMGLAINGEIVNECAAMQLPTIVVNYVGVFQAYFTLLYNSFNSDLNIALNGEAFPELMGCRFGDAIPTKIAEIYENWFNYPKIKYDLAIRHTNLLYQMVPQVDQLSQSNNQQITKGNINYTEHTSTEQLSANRVLEAINKFQTYKQLEKNVPQKRKELLAKLNWT